MKFKVHPHVLIVEDEPRLRELLARAATGWGFRTSEARSAEEALRLMEQRPHEIVLLDLNLPAMPGLDCFGHVRRRWPDTQVIILTGFGDLDAARRAIHLDVVDFLTKPAPLGDLEKALERATRRLESLAEPPADLRLDRPDPDDPTPATPAPAPNATLEEIERTHILAALARNADNRAATAAELGISLRTLYYRLNEYQQKGYL